MKLLEDAFAQLGCRLAREGNCQDLFRLRDAAFCEQLEVPLQQQARFSGACGSFDDRRESHVQRAIACRMSRWLDTRVRSWNRGLREREVKELRHRSPPRLPHRRSQSP